jgi:glycosyltransferase involved in cell wall biosynthesis
MMHLPKVLILGQSFCDFRGGGITMKNLFSHWEKDKLAVACTPHQLALKLNLDVCDTYYQLGEQEYKFLFPFSLIQKKFSSGPVTFKASPSAANFSRPGLRHKLVHNVLYPAMEYAGILHNLTRIELSGQLKAWLDAYNPDVIYAQAFTPEGVRFNIAVQDYLQRPMAFHMMDDWPSSISEKGPFKKYWYKKIDREFRQLLDKSAVLMSISEGMSDEYERRYGRTFTAFHNPINIPFWKKFQKEDYAPSDQPCLLYSGRVGIGIDASLELIAAAVEQVNATLGTNLKFVLRAEEAPGWIKKYPSTTHKDFVAYEDVPKVLAGADILVLPYDFSEASIRFIKYSMPTKASEYMMSGTPVLLFGPPDTAVMQYADQQQCFETCTINSVDAVVAAITRLVSDERRRREIGERAKTIAAANHDAVKIAEAFNRILSGLVPASVPGAAQPV